MRGTSARPSSRTCRPSATPCAASSRVSTSRPRARNPAYPWTDDDPDADWRAEGETPASVLARYADCCARADEVIAAAPSLDAMSARETRRGPVSLRWVLLHMVEETARHAGQADVLRELTDGSVGE